MIDKMGCLSGINDKGDSKMKINVEIDMEWLFGEYDPEADNHLKQEIISEISEKIYRKISDSSLDNVKEASLKKIKENINEYIKSAMESHIVDSLDAGGTLDQYIQERVEAQFIGSKYTPDSIEMLIEEKCKKFVEDRIKQINNYVDEFMQGKLRSYATSAVEEALKNLSHVGKWSEIGFIQK